MEGSKFQVFKSIINQRYYFKLKAATGEIILGSEGFDSKEAYLKAITAVKSSALHDVHYERIDEKTYTFNLKSGNGEIIGKSENYNSRLSRENGINAVKTNAAIAQIEELL